MSSISAHGGLLHVVLYVRSVTSEGVTVLVVNSPNLLTFHSFIDTFELLDQDLKAALTKKTANRKLFKGGSYEVGEIHSHFCTELRLNNPHVDLESLWP